MADDAWHDTGATVVTVAFPIAVQGMYDYRLPERFHGSVVPGTPVQVTLRSRSLWGVAVALKSHSDFPNLKEVQEIKTDRWTDSGSTLLKLYEWVASYYQCDLGRVFKPLMRKGLMKSRAKTVFAYSVKDDADISTLNTRQKGYIEQLRSTASVSVDEAQRHYGISRAALTTLWKKGVVDKNERTILREAAELGFSGEMENVELSDEQHEAVDFLVKEAKRPSRPALLYGITGSGKTHVYIELAARMLQQGKGVIILVPEIALTPQTIQRFKAALGPVITVIHSNMSDGERRDSLQELVSGTKRMVIGVRSAVLAPMDNLGCIIVDEEHDGSYKQSDMDPRYHARDVAVMRGYFQKALVVLGSATPSFESYTNACNGKYDLIRLTKRFGEAVLPRVEVVDMREEQKANNWKPVSRMLLQAIRTTIENDRQIILLLNRRGFSTVLLCQECSFTAECPHCSISMRYHRADSLLKCHICGYERGAPDTCPKCGGSKIKYQGTGIQKIEQYLLEVLPEVRIIRMDQDSTRKKGAHADFLHRFAQREADILLGTQMVAKGLNFPGVALVGVIGADTGLHLPDFRAAERTFQLLTQVAGRAGRADSCGEVIIQTYNPEEAAIRFAARHDYTAFYDHENRQREGLSYPPFGRLARIIVEGRSEHAVQQYIYRIAGIIKRSQGYTAMRMLGPSPAALERIAGESRYAILLKAADARILGTVLREIRGSAGKKSSGLQCLIDVDPVNML